MVGGGWAISEDEALEHVYRVEVDDVVAKLTFVVAFGLPTILDVVTVTDVSLVVGGGGGGGAIKELLSILTEALALEFVTRQFVVILLIVDVLTSIVAVSCAAAAVISMVSVFVVASSCGSVCLIPTNSCVAICALLS